MVPNFGIHGFQQHMKDDVTGPSSMPRPKLPARPSGVLVLHLEDVVCSQGPRTALVYRSAGIDCAQTFGVRRAACICAKAPQRVS